MLGAWVWGQPGTSVKDQGSHDLASEYGAQRACFNAKMNWDQKRSNQIIPLLCGTFTDRPSNKDSSVSIVSGLENQGFVVQFLA